MDKYGIHEMEATNGWLDKKCQWCGKYFEYGEKIVLIVPLTEYKHKYKKLSSNVLMHLDEFKTVRDECKDDQEAILIKIANHKTKRLKNELSEIQLKECEAFVQACVDKGFNIETKSKQEIKMRKRGTSFVMSYNPRSKRIHLNTRCRIGLFDGMYMSAIENDIYNKMQSFLGGNKKLPTKVEEKINKIIEDAEKIISR